MRSDRYPAAYPHDPIEEVFKDVFFVHGSIKIGPGMRMNRNMLIVRQDGELTLINPVRLSAIGLAQLEALGSVRHVIRLGDFHGLDDPFYVDTYGATFWCQAGQETYKTPVPDSLIEKDRVSPVQNSEFFLFDTALFPEAALLLKEHRLLITTDSVQHLTGWRYTTFFTRVVLRLLGFKLGLLIGKPWLKRVTPKGGSLKGDFDKLLQLDFDHLVSAHGTVLRGGARLQLAVLVNKIFPLVD